MANRRNNVTLVALLFLVTLAVVLGKPPHIFFIVADDLGWNDVGFRNPYVITPNIDKLAKQGMILNSSYVQPVCTPSRHSFMTGIYPFKVGLQNSVIHPPSPVCSPLKNKLLPEKLKQLGYATHMIGKWHLGFCNWNCTPTFRGFDTFYGYYNGMEDYYKKNRSTGYDFRDGTEPISSAQEYSTVSLSFTPASVRVVPYPVQPAQTTVVVTQPTYPVVQQGFRETPIQTVCIYCRNNIVTSTEYKIGAFTWLMAGVILLVGCWLGCCLIPFCVTGSKDVVHKCPNCKNTVGKYSRM